MINRTLPSHTKPCSTLGAAWLLGLLLAIGTVTPGTANTLLTTARVDKTPSQDGAVHELKLGTPIDGELKAGESRVYQITMLADQYLQVAVDQIGIDVKVGLIGPAGERLIETNGWKVAPETLWYVSEVAGNYRIEISVPDKKAAGRYAARIVALRAPTPDDRKLAEAMRLFQQARVLSNESKFDEAMVLAQRSLQLREQALPPAQLEVAQTLNLIGRLLQYNGEPQRGETFLQRALTIEEQQLGPDHLDVAVVLNDFANLNIDSGAFAAAEKLFRRALAIRENKLGASDPTVATVLNNLGTLYSDQGNYVDAELLFKRALPIWEQSLGPNSTNLAALLNNLARIYRDKGDYKQAEALFRRALTTLEQVLGPDHPNVALVLHNLAVVREREGDDAQAEQFYRQAMAIWEKKLGPDHTQVAVSLQRLAGLYEKHGDLVRAEAFYRQALSIREKALGPNHPDVAATLIDLGWLYFNRKDADFAQAESYFRLALAALEKSMGDHPRVAQALDNLAKLYQAKGDIPQALAFSSRSNEARERNLKHNLPLGSERQKLGYLNLFAEDMNNVLSLHTQLAPNNPQALHLAFTTLLRRKGRGLEAMSDSIATLRERASSQDQTLFTRLADARSRYATKALRGPDKTNTTSYRSDLKKLEEEVDSLESALSTRSAEFRAQSQPITLEAVKTAIPRGSVLIEFALYHPSVGKSLKQSAARYAAYLLAAEDRPRWVDLGAATRIDRAVAGWRLALRDPERSDSRLLARALDAMVLQPVRALLGSEQHLLISPEGSLNLIPFAALVDEHKRYLVERYTITYLTSGRDLLRLQVRRESKSAPVIVADPAFGEPATIASRQTVAGSNGISDNEAGVRLKVDESRMFFGPLPGVAEEVRALKELLPDARVLVKGQATESALKGINSPSILHVATHGFFFPEVQRTADDHLVKDTNLGKWAVRLEDPLLRSGLALAGANQGNSGSDDGVLTALEAAGLNLWGTKLVVLSACDTGVGQVKNGDGVYGLRRALVLAGSESQMMSLWPVSDRSTRDLVIGYYKALFQGKGRGEALRQSQLQMIRNKAYRHPYYWASFIQSGEWANLEGKR